ncbi:MAG: SurA N-terminal domain-containing protein [Sneathiella sp.]|nr:SurA N-terminal domain-containing protein [Sneathiella sp.]
MLHAMRKGSSGWLAKGLLILLVASFAVWGIGSGMLGSSVNSDVLEAGDESISLGEFQREYRNQVNMASARYNRQLTQEQAQLLGIPQQTVAVLRNRMVQNERARDFGLAVPDEAVRDQIKNGPSFKNVAGEFDRLRFNDLLRQNGYSEGEYINILRGEMTRGQLVESFVLPGQKAPTFLTDVFFNHYAEKRSAEYVVLADTSVGEAPTPTDEQLTAFIDENKETYTAPDYRAAKFILLTPEAFTSEVSVSDDEIQQEYEARESEFFQPERRQVLQMVFETEDKANEAAIRISGGEDFAAVAADMLQLTAADIDLGENRKADLFTELQEPVFAVEEGGVTAPVQTVLGWHLVKVAKVNPEALQTLDQVRDQIRNDVALRYAADLMHEKQTQFEDEFAGGATLDEAAQNIGVEVKTLPLTDQRGLGLDGTPVAAAPAAPEFLGELFQTEEGVEPTLVEMQNGNYFALTLTETRPSALRPLEEIREQVTAAWKADWLHTENEKATAALLDKLKAGGTLADVATEKGAEVKSSPVVLRNAPAGDLSPAATEKLFGLSDGEYAMGPTAAGNGYTLFKVKEVVPADKEADKSFRDQLANELSNSLQQDILAQYQTYLEKEVGFSVKEGLIREYFQQ